MSSCPKGAPALRQSLRRLGSGARRVPAMMSDKTEGGVAAEPYTQLFKNFVTNIIDEDIAAGRNGGRVVTRFPPEPNGYLHLGHAKSIRINFGLAGHYNGVTHMRFDDTNPEKEEMEYIRSILDDVRWLVGGSNGSEENAPAPWFGPVRHASDYFQTLYDGAEYLIQKGLAYVDDLTPEEMREYRGTLTQPGKDSPSRTRSVEENLRLFRAMKNGELPDGKCVLRAKIDMSAANMNLRDPTLYRIKRAAHPMTGDKWCIYPMYDYAHAVSDALEAITHSLCSLEFADHRPLYDWLLDALSPSGLIPPLSEKGWRPVQTEFSRLNLQYTVLSKRKLIQLVTEKHVEGWDDPRMPTISGVRRRGFPAEAIKLFCDRTGISKAENNIDWAVLEDCVRETLDNTAPRAFALQDPIKVTITNLPEETTEVFQPENHPKQPNLGSRQVPFCKHLLLDRDDFFDTGVDGSIKPPKGYKRLVPGGQVRLKYAYVITCDEVVRDSAGKAIELKVSFDASTRAGATAEGQKKVKGIIQWLAQSNAEPIDLLLYDRLFLTPAPGKDQPDEDFLKDINPNSMTVAPRAVVEKGVATAAPGSTFQFERIGYFCRDRPVASGGGDTGDSKGGKVRFNRVVTLKDTWAAKE